MNVEPRRNYRYNRYESKHNNYYITDFDPYRHFGEEEYNGYIKCKLIHSVGFSLIVPDQIYLKIDDDLLWIQPICFTANNIAKIHSYIDCSICIDIAFGAGLVMRFNNDNYVRSYRDGSQLFECVIKGPENLEKYATGTAKFNNNLPYILLYHHTRPEYAEKIAECGYYKPSRWNIQGTKQLTRLGYVYFTPLDAIQHENDLIQIGMASRGVLAFRLDQNQTSTPDLVLEVYRENTKNRCSSLSHWVAADALAPQPLYRHMLSSSPVYYEVVQYFTHRICLSQGETLEYNAERIKTDNVQISEYFTLGDATTIDGLRAPFDEEEIEDMFKIEFLDDGLTILDFWFDNCNKDLYTDKHIKLNEFESN